MFQENHIQYLTLEEVLTIHSTVIQKTGRSINFHYENGLHSALAQPKQSAFGKMCYPTLNEKAAAYMFFIAKNHPFRDGNKRTALLCRYYFSSK